MTIPAPAAIRAYLDTSGWTRHPGPSWSRDGRYAEAPDDATPDEVREILAAVARAEGRSAADVIGSVEALAKLSAPSLPSPSPAPREGVAAATGPASAIRERLEEALDASIGRCPRCKVCDTQIGAAMTVLGPLLGRAEAAEAKLATLAEHNRQHLKLPGSCCPHLAQENLAIIGSEEAAGNG